MKGKGKIVKKEWVERCHSERKRLPWRRFCLDNVRMIYFPYFCSDMFDAVRQEK